MNSKLNLLAKSLIIEVLSVSENPLDSIQVKWLVEDCPDSNNYDWHEYLNYLEDLTGRGITKYAGLSNDGRQQYRIADF